MASIQNELKNELFKRKINFIPMTYAGCQDLQKKQSKLCISKIQMIRDKKIRQFKKSTIIMHLNYNNLDQKSEKLNSFINTINKYLNLNYNIILIYPIPKFTVNVSQKILNIYLEDKKRFSENFKMNNYISLDYKKYLSETKKMISKFNKLSNKNLYFIYPDKIFCNTIQKNKCVANSSENIFFVDRSHLSKKGSEMLNSNLIEIIDEIYPDNLIN